MVAVAGAAALNEALQSSKTASLSRTPNAEERFQSLIALPVGPSIQASICMVSYGLSLAWRQSINRHELCHDPQRNQFTNQRGEAKKSGPRLD